MVELNLSAEVTPAYEYSQEETFSSFLHSVKANKDCAAVKKIFNNCRSTPLGKVIDPSLCQPHAEALISCYNFIRLGGCNQEFRSALDCLKQNGDKQSGCENFIDGYANCKLDSVAKFADYQ